MSFRKAIMVGGGSNLTLLSQSEYDELSESEKLSDKVFGIIADDYLKQEDVFYATVKTIPIISNKYAFAVAFDHGCFGGMNYDVETGEYSTFTEEQKATFATKIGYSPRVGSTQILTDLGDNEYKLVWSSGSQGDTSYFKINSDTISFHNSNSSFPVYCAAFYSVLTTPLAMYYKNIKYQLN